MKYVQILYKLGTESPQSLKQNQLKLAKLFKVPLGKIETLFSKRPVVLMARVEFERAKRYFHEFQRHGIPCIAKPLEQTAVSPKPEAETEYEGEEPQQRNRFWQIYEYLLSNWFRDRLWLMMLVLLVLPTVLIAIPIANVILTKDHHIAYLGKRNGALCADFEPLIQGNAGLAKTYEKQMYKKYLQRYKKQTNPILVRDFGYKICRVDYLLRVGNVGHKPITSVIVSLDFDKLATLFPNKRPRQHILTKVLERNNSNLVAKVTHGDLDNYIIRDLDVDTVVEFRFRAYYKRGNPYQEWTRLLVDVQSDQGKVELGSPEASPVKRVLGME